MKILVLTKARYDYSSGSYGSAGYGNPIGLNNSAAFITDALTELGYDVCHVATEDGNSVDREVSAHRPDLVLVEALWITPAKMQELVRLHSNIRWVVRLHSNIPFLGMEGMAFSWTKKLAKIKGVTVAANNRQTAEELSSVLRLPISYLPNVYLLPEYCPSKGQKRKTTYLDVSCFGAIRPLKNQLIQAVAAMSAAERLGRILRFHINGSRVEQKGDSIVQNMLALFEDSKHELVFHGWENHDDFLITIARMDIGMQVSFTESFNIVAADHVHVGVPIVVSSEIDWLSPWVMAKATSVEDMAGSLIRQLELTQVVVNANKKKLAAYNDEGNDTWTSFLGK